ncbi:Di-glucose binding protein with Kinesin motor domain [Pelomyxa schiedti]|nr:Di-glucose binding protein with Kinesin motor domain [Pelomyxa schiedti]
MSYLPWENKGNEVSRKDILLDFGLEGEDDVDNGEEVGDGDGDGDENDERSLSQDILDGDDVDGSAEPVVDSSAFDAEIQSLKTQLQEALDEVAHNKQAYEQEKTETKRQMALLQSKMKKEREDKEKELKDLMYQLQQYEEQDTKSSKTNEATLEELATITKQNEELKNTLSALKKQVVTLHSSASTASLVGLSSKSMKYLNRTKSLQALFSEYNKLHTSSSQFVEQLSNVKSSLDSVTPSTALSNLDGDQASNLAALRSEHEELKSSHALLSSSNQDMANTISTLKEDLKTSKAETKKANKQKHETAKEAEALQRRVTELEEELEKCRHDAVEKGENINSLSKQLSKLEKSANKAETTCKELEQSLLAAQETEKEFKSLLDKSSEKDVENLQLVESLKRELEMLKEEKEESTRVIGKLKQENGESKRIGDQMMQEKDEYKKLLNQMREEQAERNKVIEQFVQEKKECTNQYEALAQEKASLNKENESIKEEAEALMEKLTHLQSQLETAKKMASAGKEELKEHMAKIEQEAQEAISREAKHHKKELAQAEKLQKKTQTKMAELSEQLKETLEKVDGLELEKGKLQETISSLEIQQAHTATELESLKSSMQLLQEERTALQHQILEEKKKLDDCRKRELDQFEDNDSKMKNQVKRALDEVEELKKILEVSQSNEENLRNTISRLESETRETQAQLESVNKSLEKVQQELKQEYEQHSGTKENLAVIQKTLEKMTDEKEERAAQFEKENGNLDSDLKEAQLKRDFIYHILAVTHGEIRAMKGTIAQLNKAVSDSRATSTRLFESCNRNLQQALQRTNKRTVEALKKYHKELQKNRILYNQMQDLKGSIRVYCRKAVDGASMYISFQDDDKLCLMDKGVKKVFEYDRVYSPSATQADVFLDTVPLITSVVDGYNVCIFAYGQTGSGKTYTMEGPPHDRGVYFLSLMELFRVCKERSVDLLTEIKVSLLEIYNEQVRDLLFTLGDGERPDKYDIKQGEYGMMVPGVVCVKVTSVEEVAKVMQVGTKNRATGATNLNLHSSRSHALLVVEVATKNIVTKEIVRGKLTLVDLAGSERVSRSGAEDERLVEAQHINKSLSSLGDVIQGLVKKEPHIPYRNSKLTYLLQDSLGGNSKTLMFVQINPHPDSIGETVCSLNFASRVRNVELGPAKRHIDSPGLVCPSPAEYARCKAKIKFLEDQLQLLKGPSTSSPEAVQQLPQRSTTPHTDTANRTPSPDHTPTSPHKPPPTLTSNHQPPEQSPTPPHQDIIIPIPSAATNPPVIARASTPLSLSNPHETPQQTTAPTSTTNSNTAQQQSTATAPVIKPNVSHKASAAAPSTRSSSGTPSSSRKKTS